MTFFQKTVRSVGAVSVAATGWLLVDNMQKAERIVKLETEVVQLTKEIERSHDLYIAIAAALAASRSEQIAVNMRTR